jgi:hypothetical protein
LCLEAPDLSATSCPGPLVDNPLFAGGRGPESVYLAGIVGVPWQEIASRPEPRDCSALDPMLDACDCLPGDSDRPRCEVSPGQSLAGTTQFFAKAYPGLRDLEVLRGQGNRGAIASSCARNVCDDTRSDFGYRPAMASLLERTEPGLGGTEAP